MKYVGLSAPEWMGDTANKTVMNVGPLECLSKSGKGFFLLSFIRAELSFQIYWCALSCVSFLLFKDFFFNVDHFKSLYWICYIIAFFFFLMFWFFCPEAHGPEALAPQSGVETTPLRWKAKSYPLDHQGGLHMFPYGSHPQFWWSCFLAVSRMDHLLNHDIHSMYNQWLTICL